MAEKVGKVTARRYDQLLKRALRAVEAISGHQFDLGDIALEIEPMKLVGGAGGGTYETLRMFAEDIGLEFETLISYRSTAAAWPSNKRQLSMASFTTHRILNGLPSRFSLIKRPIKNPRTGRKYWRTDDAARAAGRSPSHPETREEKVAKVHDLVKEDDVAATVATTLLCRPEVASRAMADHTARHIVNNAQFDRSRQVRDDIEERIPAARELRYSMEVNQLIGGCTAFVAAVNRALPTLRGRQLAKQEREAIHRYLDNVRSAADWCQTAVDTDDTSMDEQLAQLLAED
ncbi:DUF6192 family protein [Amycolatopsis sp. H20-H5]|uniref:DUF6192 family protein n=1 Tax=Amycolatopsis sp. H20-H5 TaxID=3046309 RepID=UPI002DBA829C|nr:DUF6192 family protein [Amycolatopsis sp. H20-H5]MEC3982553.1 DUF6192 family protein [Amycolatopsis sp. H20-H5]